MDTSSQYSQLSEQEIIRHFQVSTKKGLSDSAILKQRAKFGLNTLQTKQVVTKLKILIQQLKSIIVFLLFTAAVISFLLNQWLEALAIVIVLFINTLIGFVMELRAIRSMEALRRLGNTTTTVLRNDKIILIDAEDLVPGDIALFEAGDIITADIRLIEASKLEADESALTGESVPVDKKTGTLTTDVVLAERKNMLFKGTFLTRGSGRGIVVATGMHTELGHIAKITEEANEETTPLEKRLDKLGLHLVWGSVFIAMLVAVIGVLAGKEVWLMFETSVALAVATIPEGLPIVATMALARGMWRMAKQNALINRLSAVETLGATSIIFTDKTGTLTENKMAVRSFYTNHEYIEIVQNKVINFLSTALKKSLKVAALCSNASLQEDELGGFVGDPMEIALLRVSESLGYHRESLLEKYPELKEEAFDSDTRMMATYHKDQDKVFVAVKGAPEQVIQSCMYLVQEGGVRPLSAKDRNRLLEKNHEMAFEGLRVLGLAYKEVDSKNNKPYEQLIFSGLVGLIDPARLEVKEALKKCRTAGIRVIMVTGDQEGTAKKIAQDIELTTDANPVVIRGDELGERKFWSEEFKKKIRQASIFSRVSPQQKLDLIEFYQEQKAIVGMTGDGVNDAPALKRADIGIAMGLRGTQVAKEAADMVLKDDEFNTIVVAIQEGRIIFSNIRRFVVYLLSCNISEIFVISIAAVVNAPLPLLPLQILFLNLVTDVFPALALGMGEGGNSFLALPPRKGNEPIITSRNWRLIVGYGLLITTAVLTAFFYSLNQWELVPARALTISFLTLGFAQVFHVFNMRHSDSKLVSNDVTRNPYIWGAVGLCAILLVTAVYLPGISHTLNLVAPTFTEWKLIMICSLLPFLVGQISMSLGLGFKK